ncbi:MAG: hypothetical protein A2Y62_19930 [Candidatus Fischerbacteria bacterium RBG_13_37_8]|uniref:Uncharacterized protein n=1 Tax=Candidatus Fischerbacteria bacterium RBG_13_37_8 TaxID=1817863 RepID=A0A1F5VNU4_9BACT|nr:MAG: hypothetical protein A2Y62_19930 [Candidatus Fischerbacteria bacterium RBG_13_37_8]
MVFNIKRLFAVSPIMDLNKKRIIKITGYMTFGIVCFAAILYCFVLLSRGIEPSKTIKGIIFLGLFFGTQSLFVGLLYLISFRTAAERGIESAITTCAWFYSYINVVLSFIIAYFISVTVLLVFFLIIFPGACLLSWRYLRYWT